MVSHGRFELPTFPLGGVIFCASKPISPVLVNPGLLAKFFPRFNALGNRWKPILGNDRASLKPQALLLDPIHDLFRLASHHVLKSQPEHSVGNDRWHNHKRRRTTHSPAAGILLVGNSKLVTCFGASRLQSHSQIVS
jgi:hypothetical protein